MQSPCSFLPVQCTMGWRQPPCVRRKKIMLRRYPIAAGHVGILIRIAVGRADSQRSPRSAQTARVGSRRQLGSQSHDTTRTRHALISLCPSLVL